MSYNKTIFNTPTIYIDIQADFDRTLDVLIMVGQLNKIKDLEEERKVKKAFERNVAHFGRKLDKLGDTLGEKEKLVDMVLDMYVNRYSNIPLRDTRGRFTSSHKSVKGGMRYLLDWQEYKPVLGLYKKMTPAQQNRLIQSWNKFIQYQAISIELNKQLELYGNRVLKNMEFHDKAKKELTKAEKELANARAQLKKLGFVAIIKMMDDIEKKARRYKL